MRSPFKGYSSNGSQRPSAGTEWLYRFPKKSMFRCEIAEVADSDAIVVLGVDQKGVLVCSAPSHCPTSPQRPVLGWAISREADRDRKSL